MIKRTELRPGCQFLYEGNIYTVEFLVQDSILTGKYDNNGIFEIDRFVPYEDAQPIPITGETLVKLGFADRTGSSYESFEFPGLFIRNDFGDGWIVQQEQGTIGRVKMHHLHQLQMLYWAVMGKELKLES